jgi:hypothetical protein
VATTSAAAFTAFCVAWYLRYFSRNTVLVRKDADSSARQSSTSAHLLNCEEIAVYRIDYTV